MYDQARHRRIWSRMSARALGKDEVATEGGRELGLSEFRIWTRRTYIERSGLCLPMSHH